MQGANRIRQQVLPTRVTKRSEPWALIMALATFVLFALATARLGRHLAQDTSHSPLILGHSKVMGAAAVTQRQTVNWCQQRMRFSALALLLPEAAPWLSPTGRPKALAPGNP
jgi:hypothetical protein